jgi:hypothetical protein
MKKILFVFLVIGMFLLSGCGKEEVKDNTPEPKQEPTTPAEPTEPTTPTTPAEPTEPTTPIINYPELETTKKEVDLDKGYDINIKLDEEIDKSLDDGEISHLIDSIISFKSSDYDVSEHLILTDSMASSSISEEDFEDKPYLIFQKKSIKYKYRFDESIDYYEVDEEDPLNIKLLGEKLRITDIEDGEMTVRIAKEYFLYTNDLVTVDDKVIKLVRVGSANSIIVDVDGVQETIPGGHTETVNGIEITNDETFYDSGSFESCAATLLIGEDVEKTIKDGDYYSDNEIWEYKIEVEDDKPVISLILDVDYTEIDDDEDYKALGLGDSLSLPNDYIIITYSKVDADYTEYSFEEEGSYYVLSTSEEDIDDEFKKVYLNNEKIGTISAHCSNTSYTNQTSCEGAGYCSNTSYTDQTSCELASGTWTNYGFTWTPDEDVYGYVFYEDDEFETEIERDYVELGDSELKFYNDFTIRKGTTELFDINDLNDEPYKTRDEDLLTSYGLIFRDPKEWYEDKEIDFEINDEQLEVKINFQ